MTRRPSHTQELKAGKLDAPSAYSRLVAEVMDSKPALTHPMRVVGNAMTPTLNHGVAAGALGETVLVRQLKGSDIYVGGSRGHAARLLLFSSRN